MATAWGAGRPRLLLLIAVVTAVARVGGHGSDDFDLADALPDPDSTSKPGGAGLYPELPRDPEPRPRPQPGEPGGSAGSAGHDGHGDPHGGNQPVNPVAAIVSPVVSLVVVALLGAGVSFCRSGRGRGCLRVRVHGHESSRRPTQTHVPITWRLRNDAAMYPLPMSLRRKIYTSVLWETAAVSV